MNTKQVLHFQRVAGEPKPIPGQRVSSQWGEGMIGVVSAVTSEDYQVTVMREADLAPCTKHHEHSPLTEPAPDLFLVPKDVEAA